MSDVIVFTKDDFKVARANCPSQPQVHVAYPATFEAIRKASFGRCNNDIESIFNQTARGSGSISSVNVKINETEKTLRFTLGGADSLLKVAETDFAQICANAANTVVERVQRRMAEQTAAISAPRPASGSQSMG